MRIISGKFKNKKIFFPKNFKTRPLRDSVKENIFNILEHSKKIDLNVYNSNVLDLYAGSGSFGLETISRYKAKVNFIDAIKTIKQKKILKENHIIILHRDRESKDYINNKLSIFESRKYGRSLIIFGKLF